MPAYKLKNSGEQPYAEETVVGTQNIVASSNSGTSSGWGSAKTLRAQLITTGASGTNPTLDVTIEDTLDGTNWNTIATFTQVTGTSAARNVQNVTTPFADRIRVKWVQGGTGGPQHNGVAVIIASDVD